jgi:hypothetical protein
MVKYVGAVKNYSENTKNVMINVEDGTGLVRVILWWKQNGSKAAQGLIHKCNGNGFIHDRRGIRLLWCSQDHCF